MTIWLYLEKNTKGLLDFLYKYIDFMNDDLSQFQMFSS